MGDFTTDWWSKQGFRNGTWNRSASGVSGSNAVTGPAYEQVSAIPGWLPKSDMHELADQYGKVGENYDTAGYDVASEGSQSRVLTTALNAGNNAAAEYANRARQAGGSGMGAGLIKAEAAVGANKVAGDMKLEQQKFDASQREKAATQSALIATNLAQLRESYLKTIVGYATATDSTKAGFASSQASTDAANRATDEKAREFNFSQKTTGGYQTDTFGNISNLYGLPFRDSSGMPSSDVNFAPTNRKLSSTGG